MMFDGVDPNDRTPQQQPPVRRLLLPLCPAVPPGLFSFLSPNNRLMPVFTFFFFFILIWRHPVGAVPRAVSGESRSSRWRTAAATADAFVSFFPSRPFLLSSHFFFFFSISYHSNNVEKKKRPPQFDD
jgi:hypothetical protein